MNEVVKYSNELHELNFSSLTEAQQNVLFTLLQQFRNTDSYTLELDFNKVFELANIADNNIYRKEILIKLKYLQTFTFIFQTNDLEDLAQEVIFPKIETDSQNRVLKIKVSKGFKDRYISSPLKGWTRYELAEFVGLNGIYTKTIYRYLKQFKSSGRWCIRYDDFKELLGIPKSYQSCDINKRILKPAIKELSSERNLFDQRRIPFEKLVIIKHKKGREIKTLEFCFVPQAPTILDRDIKAHERSLETIAQDIRQEQMLKQIRKFKIQSKEQEPPKINPITGKEVDELYAYIGRHFIIKNKFDDGYDSCKICNLYQDLDGRIYGDAINQDTGKLFEFKSGFDNIEHLKNALLLENA